MAYTNNWCNVIRGDIIIGQMVPKVGLTVTSLPYPQNDYTVTKVDANTGLITLTPYGLPVGSGDIQMYAHLVSVDESSAITNGFTSNIGVGAGNGIGFVAGTFTGISHS